MVEKDETTEETPAAPTAPAPRRGPGHRGADMRDTVAEMAERAQLISQEAGSKVSSAMKDVISAAAGLAGFAIESARDLVQYMVRRGQMTPEEGDKLLREAEVAHAKRPASERKRPTASEVQTKERAAQRAKAAAERVHAMLHHVVRAPVHVSARKAAPRKSAPAKGAAKRTKVSKPAKSAKKGKRR